MTAIVTTEKTAKHCNMPQENSSDVDTKDPDTRKPQVTFCTNNLEEIHQIPNRKSFTKKEKSKLWLSDAEFRERKQEDLRMLEEMKDSEDSGIFDYRGLEMVDPSHIARRQRHKTDTISFVLIEQREQRWKRISDPKAIRKVYKKHVTESKREALENAYIDRKSVVEYLSTTNEELELQYNMEKTRRKTKSSFLATSFKQLGIVRSSQSTASTLSFSSDRSFVTAT